MSYGMYGLKLGLNLVQEPELRQRAIHVLWYVVENYPAIDAKVRQLLEMIRCAYHLFVMLRSCIGRATHHTTVVWTRS